MRGRWLGVAALATLVATGCARKDPVVARLEGSEPQRLAFGDARSVQAAFIDKMTLCWFTGQSALLAGHRYELSPVVFEGDNGPIALEQITILSNQTGGPAFVVHFHPFNDNTLISTRNLAFPQPVAAYMKRDIETWVFGRPDCAPPDGAAPYPQPPLGGDLKSTSPLPAPSSGALSPPRSGWGS